MRVLTVGFFVILVQAVFSEADLSLNPCHTTDIQCLSKNTENFLEHTCAGNKDLDFKAIDPLIIPSLEVDTIPGEKIFLTNVNVSGLKKLKIKDFKMDLDKKSVLLAMAAVPHVEGDIKVDNGVETVTGRFSSQPTYMPVAAYTYDLIKNDKGVEYFTVGKETLTCELSGVPTISTSDNVNAVLFKDKSRSHVVTLAVLCKVAETAFETIIHNLRASAKIFPKSAYFTNI